MSTKLSRDQAYRRRKEAERAEEITRLNNIIDACRKKAADANLHAPHGRH